jgi:putative zinc finger protein
VSTCAVLEPGDLELHFYGELDEASEARVVAHLRACAACRRELDDLHAISSALGTAAPVDAPQNGDWSSFMARLDGQVHHARAVRTFRGRGALHLWAIAATFLLIAIGGYLAARTGVLVRHDRPIAQAGQTSQSPPVVAISADTALREVAAEHIERSKVVVLGLAMRDPRAQPDDWEYERRLAGSLLSDTRLYRRAAQQKGMNDVAHVLGDLETVLLEASLSDNTDRGALERVQRLISKRDLVVKMQVVAGSTGI